MTSVGLEMLNDSNIYLWGQWGKGEFRPLSWLEGEGYVRPRAC